MNWFSCKPVISVPCTAKTWLSGHPARFCLVDDTQLCLTLPPDLRKAVETMNWCLVAVWGWMKTKKVELNTNKVKCYWWEQGLTQELREISSSALLLTEQVFSFVVLLDLGLL